jgi:hypothetical protein
MRIVVYGLLQGTTKVRSEAVEAISKKEDWKDENVVFVAGATGRVGSRTVRFLSASSHSSKIISKLDVLFLKLSSCCNLFQGAFETRVTSQSWREEC